LLVEDNREWLRYLETCMGQAGWQLLAAESARQAYKEIGERMPDAALLDYRLPDGNGLELAVELRRRDAHAPIIIMTGMELAPEEEAVCEEYDFAVLRKPFRAADMVSLLRARLNQPCEACA
jgi:DNA-binding response OmpR family regulator